MYSEYFHQILDKHAELYIQESIFLFLVLEMWEG